MVEPPKPPDFDVEKATAFLNDLTGVTFTYKNGTSVSFHGEALDDWTKAYKALIYIQNAALKIIQSSIKPTPPEKGPTTLANELKKRS